MVLAFLSLLRQERCQQKRRYSHIQAKLLVLQWNMICHFVSKKGRKFVFGQRFLCCNTASWQQILYCCCFFPYLHSLVPNAIITDNKAHLHWARFIKTISRIWEWRGYLWCWPQPHWKLVGLVCPCCLCQNCQHNHFVWLGMVLPHATEAYVC